jgi:hypothetical protein
MRKSQRSDRLAPSPTVRAMLRWLRQRAPFAAMGLLTLVLAHNLVFVVGYGAAYREALSRTGHGGAWTTAVVVVLGLGLGLLLAGAWRIAALTRQARGLGSIPLNLRARPAFLPGLVSLWVRLALTGTVLYTVQENIEHLRAGSDLPGVAVLVPGGGPDTLGIVAAVAAGVALVGQLFLWRRAVLSARIAAARLRLPRAAASFPRPLQDAGRRPSSILGQRLAVRAPPLG